VEKITPQIDKIAGGEGSSRGTGGMRSKIAAARIATEAGMNTVIANGSQPRIIDAILSGQEVGTLFQA